MELTALITITCSYFSVRIVKYSFTNVCFLVPFTYPHRHLYNTLLSVTFWVASIKI